MADLTLEEARRILSECDTRDPARAIEAVALVLRFEGIADTKLLPIAGQLESVADSLRATHGEQGPPTATGPGGAAQSSGVPSGAEAREEVYRADGGTAAPRSCGETPMEKNP